MSDLETTLVRDSYARLCERIEATCRRCGRETDEVVVVGASKRQPVERLQAAYEAGLRVFGENRVQEALAKRPRLPANTHWHLIGPLQSNKASKAVELFEVVETVDRMKIAAVLDRHAAKRGAPLGCLIEVNLGGETTKHGFAPGDVLAAAQTIAGLPRLELLGLMAIPPPADRPEDSRPWFRKLRLLRDRLGSELDDFPGLLSMGMSADFEVAIEEGASHVRVGTELFGERASPG